MYDWVYGIIVKGVGFLMWIGRGILIDKAMPVTGTYADTDAITIYVVKHIEKGLNIIIHIYI